MGGTMTTSWRKHRVGGGRAPPAAPSAAEIGALARRPLLDGWPGEAVASNLGGAPPQVIHTTPEPRSKFGQGSAVCPSEQVEGFLQPPRDHLAVSSDLDADAVDAVAIVSIEEHVGQQLPNRRREREILVRLQLKEDPVDDEITVAAALKVRVECRRASQVVGPRLVEHGRQPSHVVQP